MWLYSLNPLLKSIPVLEGRGQADTARLGVTQGGTESLILNVLNHITCLAQKCPTRVRWKSKEQDKHSISNTVATSTLDSSLGHLEVVLSPAKHQLLCTTQDQALCSQHFHGTAARRHWILQTVFPDIGASTKALIIICPLHRTQGMNDAWEWQAAMNFP